MIKLSQIAMAATVGLFAAMPAPSAADTSCVENPRCQFHFPQSNHEFLDPADLIGLSKQTLWEARNEIFARKGYRFTTSRTRRFFSTKPYYQPRTSSVNLNRFEKRNVRLLKQAEEGGLRLASPAAQGSASLRMVAGLKPVKGNSLAVRTGPGTRYGQIGELQNGDVVVVEGRSGDWLRIRIGGQRGWINSSYTTELQPTPAEVTELNVIVQNRIVAPDRSVEDSRAQAEDRSPSNASDTESARDRTPADPPVRAAEGRSYVTPVRPADRSESVTPRRLSERLQKVPYYIPGTEDEGEMWLEPTVSDSGDLEFRMHFVDLASEYDKVRFTIPLTSEETNDLSEAFSKVREWPSVAKENYVRDFSKTITCIPTCVDETDGPTPSWCFGSTRTAALVSGWRETLADMRGVSIFRPRVHR